VNPAGGFVLAFAFAMASGTMPATSGRTFGHCLRYDPDTVEISGALHRLTFPGPPNYESVAEGDLAETGFYLLLARPICTTGDSASDILYPVAGADTVQLVLDSIGYARLRPYVGRVVTVQGTLFARHTGHHHAPLLLSVIWEH